MAQAGTVPKRNPVIHPPHPLRCYAKRLAPGRWYAVCIDLNLDAEADSLPAVKQSLDHAIVGYLRTVFDTREPSSLVHLVSRPAPLHERLIYYAASALSRLRAARPEEERRYAVFTDPVPGQLAGNGA